MVWLNKIIILFSILFYSSYLFSIELNDDGGKDVFLHVSALEAAGIDTLEEGMPVEFEIGENRGKENAVNIKKK